MSLPNGYQLNYLPLSAVFFCGAIASLLLANAPSYATEQLPLAEEADVLDFTVTAGSWMSVSVLPSGKSFIFDLLGDIYRVNIDGGDAEVVTDGMAFDSQPVVSPNGEKIAFISDRNGKDNLWIANVDGSEPIKLSEESYAQMISPAWSPDSQHIVITRRTQDVELVQYHIDGGTGVTLTQNGDTDATKQLAGIGAAFDPKGTFIYFAERLGGPDSPTKNFPVTQIVRLNLDTGARLQITRSEGGAVRPLVSPDGQWLVYGTRFEAHTGLRIRDLHNGHDRWLIYPVQRDTQENARPSSRGMLPGYAFTPDSKAIILSSDGQFNKINLVDSASVRIPFSADVAIPVGPDLTQHWRVPEGSFLATLAQDPDISPDNTRMVASVLTELYTLEKNGAPPKRLTPKNLWSFKPVYSPDGRWIAFVSWSANDGGHVWKIRSDGSGKPRQLTDNPAFYTDIVWQPDGQRIWGLRGNEWMRHQDYSEFSGLSIPLELISIHHAGKDESVVLEAGDARVPHFGPESDRIYLSEAGTLFSINLNGEDRRNIIRVSGPKGNRFAKDAPGAEELRISPDGNFVLAHVIKQVWLLRRPRVGATVPEVSVRNGSTPVAQLTDIGADYIKWSNGGKTVMWTLGSTIFERGVETIEFASNASESDCLLDSNSPKVSAVDANHCEDDVNTIFKPQEEHDAVTRTAFNVEIDQNTPVGHVLLRGANLISMEATEAVEMGAILLSQDILITNNRIAAIGETGSLTVPSDTFIVDVAGKWIIPGMIDTHAHWEFRTGDVLEPSNWSISANLAYGVTSGLDVQTAQHDYFAYRDMQRSGQVIGQRAFMTGPGIFGDNDFLSYDAVHSYLRRYSDYYKTPNIKAYISGNRQQRQWLITAANALNLMPTTEGSGDQKLDLTHAIDGMHGNEHNLPDTPLFDDVIQLFAQTRTAYTPTLIVQYNAESMREYFFTRYEIHDDPKLGRFYPHNRLDELTRRRPSWVRDDEFRFKEGAAAAAAIQRAGGLVGVGGHAEVQGLSFHWEMWAYAMGGMTSAEILRAATIDAAHIIGAPSDLGSIEVGKLADLVILHSNPMEDIRNTIDIDKVVQNGRLFDGQTLEQLWPEQIPFRTSWWQTNQEKPPMLNVHDSTQ